MPQVVDAVPYGKYRQDMEDQDQRTALSQEPVPWIEAALAVIWTLVLRQPTTDISPVGDREIRLTEEHFDLFGGGESIGE